jgi:hypothetical protein
LARGAALSRRPPFPNPIWAAPQRERGPRTPSASGARRTSPRPSPRGSRDERDRALGFADARGCSEWLGALPLTNIPQAQALVLEQLQALNAADIGALERLKCLELMRDKIAFLQGEQRSRYFGKTHPALAQRPNAWTTGARSSRRWRRATASASRTPRRAATAAQHEALIAQRIMRYIGAQMLFHALVYRRFDPQLWTRLHELYGEAEKGGIAATAVKDSLEGEGGASSVADAYTQVVLLQAAFLSEMTRAAGGFRRGAAEALVAQGADAGRAARG